MISLSKNSPKLQKYRQAYTHLYRTTTVHFPLLGLNLWGLTWITVLFGMAVRVWRTLESQVWWQWSQQRATWSCAHPTAPSCPALPPAIRLTAPRPINTAVHQTALQSRSGSDPLSVKDRELFISSCSSPALIQPQRAAMVSDAALSHKHFWVISKMLSNTKRGKTLIPINS